MKYAVITGSTKGIGRAIAERLLHEGYFCIINYAHDDVAAKQFIEDNLLFTGQFEIVKMELSSYENVQRFLESVKSITTQVDCLILNAGITDRSAFGEITKDSWEKVINTNINAPFFVVQGCFDIITPITGRVIFIGSVCGHFPHASSPSYGVTKAAVHQMAKELVKFFAPKQVTVNAIAPGFTDTEWQKSKEPNHRKRIEEKTALKRFADAEEIASLCMEIVRNQFINGSCLDIDGGYCYF